VPVLVDGKPHNIMLDVASAEDDRAINANWYLSANLQVVRDPSSRPTTGTVDAYAAAPYGAASNAVVRGADGAVTATTTASRQVRIESTIRSGSGGTTVAVWSQDLQFRNVQRFLDNATVQVGGAAWFS
jgi:hypothetical protein